MPTFKEAGLPEFQYDAWFGILAPAATPRPIVVKVSEAVGEVHPGLITPDDVDILDGTRRRTSLREVYEYEPDWGSLGPDLRAEVEAHMHPPGSEPPPTD